MKINKASFVAGAGSAVLFGAALIPNFVGAQTADSTATATATATDESGAADVVDCGPGGVGLRGFGGPIGEDLATALGVSVEDLQAAAQSARDSLGDVERPTTDEERDALKAQMQTALASALGISEADLQSAIDEVQAAKQAEAIARVQEKVTDGTLTQDEADAIIERIESGEAPFGFGVGGPGGHGCRGFGGPRGFGGGFPGGTSNVTPDA
ncbi:MAG: hypothetical protein KC461_13640 [Dehalococcoidia bacterium]|nr:hypothetical protein [Dehalococcoidia bacterium]